MRCRATVVFLSVNYLSAFADPKGYSFTLTAAFLWMEPGPAISFFDSGKVVQEMKGLSSAHDVELAPSGDIWLADTSNDRTLRLTPNLRELWGAPYNFRGPRYQGVCRKEL